MAKAKQTKHLAASDVLHGRKVRLRLPRVDELSFLRTLWGDPETMAPVGGPLDWPETKVSDWYARVVDPGGLANCYCLILDRDDTPVGEVSFHRWDSEDRSAELNVKVLAAHRRRGYGKDALRTFLKFFFGRVAGRLMTDDVALANRPGRRLLESLGVEKDDSVSDVCRMTMTRQRYLKQYEKPSQAMEDIGE